MSLSVNPIQQPSASPSPIHQVHEGKGIGHFFKKLLALPIFLLTLIFKIGHLVTSIFKSSPSAPAVPSSHIVSLIPQSPKATSIAHATLSSEKGIVDVPDDGNCLFYSLGVGLRKKSETQPQIQELLQWDIPLESLQGDLSRQGELLKKPGATLRTQAARYLEQKQSEDEILVALMGGIIDLNEVVRRKVQDEEQVQAIVTTDISELEKRTPTEDVRRQLQEKQRHLSVIQKSLSHLKGQIVSEDDTNRYIQITKEDRVYCGGPQIYALSKLYNVPIKVLYSFGTPQQREDIFNSQPGVTPITLAHVNGNHFKYVED